jgi:hypothetical protein
METRIARAAAWASLAFLVPSGSSFGEGGAVTGGRSGAPIRVSTFAAPECPAGLCDLNVPPARLGVWAHATVAEAAYQDAQDPMLWPEYDPTCGANPCPSGKETVRTVINSGTCANLVTTGDGSNLDCFVDNAPNASVIWLPIGDYAMQNGVATSNGSVVLRGESHTGTILRRTTTGRTSVNSGACDTNTGAMLISVCAPSQNGSTTTWTSGRAVGTTVVTLGSTAGLSIGGWVDLWMQGSLACEHIDKELNGGGDPDALHHQARITAISGNDVTIDRPLLLDYGATGCTGHSARPWAPVEKFGLENLRLTTTTSIPTGGDSNTNIKFAAIRMTGVAESWMVNVTVDRVYDAWAKIAYSARNWFQGNNFSNTDVTVSFSTEGLSFEEGATDNVAENNWFTAPRVGSKIEMSEATVWAYNFADMDAVNGERCAFNHGHYTRATLFEGNDCDDELLMADAFWGRNGLHITAYRNRARRQDCGTSISGTHAGITFDVTGGPAPILADEPNIIGNIAWVFTVAPFANSLGCDPPQRNGDSLNVYSSGLPGRLVWAERNVYTHGGSEAFDFVDPVGQVTNRSCGTGFSDACPGTNEGASGPHTGAGQMFPNTLYRDRSEPPTWWCQESCSWDSDGIGAFGDDFGGALCKLPAQIRAEGGVCTPM